MFGAAVTISFHLNGVEINYRKAVETVTPPHLPARRPTRLTTHTSDQLTPAYPPSGYGVATGA